jgi:hypothetical protein
MLEGEVRGIGLGTFILKHLALNLRFILMYVYISVFTICTVKILLNNDHCWSHSTAQSIKNKHELATGAVKQYICVRMETMKIVLQYMHVICKLS